MIQMQLGKNGLTLGFIEDIRKRFANTESVRISILQSATRNKEEVKKWAEEITGLLGKNYTNKVIGWTIVLRKWRKAKN